MTFDNSKTIINLRIKLFAATIILMVYFIVTYAARLIRFPLLGMSETVWTLILVFCYLLVVFLPALLNYQYIFYSDDGNNIIFRYFTSGILGGRKNSVEIDKKTFSGYKVETGLFGLVQSIILYQRLKEGVAKYPPIYISALSREEKNKIYRSLNTFAPKL